MFVEINYEYEENSGNKEIRCKKGFRSKQSKINLGVPQGSILGPPFFIIFINDIINYILNNIPDINLTIYADDTNAIVSDGNIDHLNSMVNETLKYFDDWFTVNGLKINANKTNIMLFQSTIKTTDKIHGILNGEKIDTVKVAKFLGVYMDNLLNWKHELSSLVSTISSACYVLRSLRAVIGLEQLKTVYYALVESKLRSSILFWGGSYQYNIDKAFIAQKRAIRTMVRIKQEDSCREHFIKLNILTVPSLYVMVLLMNLAKNIDNFETYEERIKREKTRRLDLSSNIIPHLKVVSHCSQINAKKLYNKLPTSLKQDLYNSTFKASLKAFLLEKCLYSVGDL